MSDPHVRYELSGAAAVLTIDRPEARNALSQQAISELHEGLIKAGEDSAVRVVVLTGGGSRVFCAGGDLSTMSSQGGFLGGHDSRRHYGTLLRSIQDCAKPTLARINGHAIAGGVGLVLACDLAVAVDSAEIGLPEIDRGLFPMMVTALLQRHIGRKRALELLLMGNRIKAQDALAMGLINRAVPAVDLDSTVTQFVETLAGKSLAVLRLGKRAFFTAEDLALGPALEHLASQLSLNVLADDAAEGVSSFLEKRKPSWKDQ